MIRRALYPDHYKPMFSDPGAFLGFSHTDHCIDSIRYGILSLRYPDTVLIGHRIFVFVANH